jgi:hypothetical protein
MPEPDIRYAVGTGDDNIRNVPFGNQKDDPLINNSTIQAKSAR